MLNYIMKKYALSRQGAKDLVIATVSCVVHNLTLMLPVSLLYLLVSDLYAGGIPQNHLWIYIVGMAAAVLLILFSYRWVYGATYYATYKESSVRRISLAEKLRKLPLSFFGKRDLSDLTTTIMADCTTLEQSFSHWIPEFFGSMISTVIVAVCLFIFDWRLALAALWVLPVSLAIVAFSEEGQRQFAQFFRERNTPNRTFFICCIIGRTIHPAVGKKNEQDCRHHADNIDPQMSLRHAARIQVGYKQI